MTVRIIMERTVDTDKREQLVDLMKKLRAKALLRPGYISGETLISVDRPGTHIVISTWHSLSDWKAWENHPERLEILAQIDALLTAPAKINVYGEPWSL